MGSSLFAKFINCISDVWSFFTGAPLQPPPPPATRDGTDAESSDENTNGLSLFAKFINCISDVSSFFKGAPLQPPPPPATSDGTDVESSDENTNGLPTNTHPMGSSQINSTSPTQSSTNTQLSAKAIRDRVKLFLPITLVPMVYLWGLDIHREQKWYCEMALCLLSVAFTTLYTGTSLANMHPYIANGLSQVGIGCTYLTFFMLVGSRIPAELKIFPAICCTVCLVGDIYRRTSLR